LIGRVLMLLSNTFRPDPRVLKEARGLISNGYGVTLLAWDREGNRPQEDTVGGVNVHRIRAIRIRGQLGMVIGMINFWAKAVLSSRKAAFDVVHAHDFDTLIPAVLISRLRRVPLVYDAHEHYSRMIAIDAPPAVMRLIDRLELRLVWSTDLVVTVSPPLATRFVAVGGPDVVIEATGAPAAITAKFIDEQRSSSQKKASARSSGRASVRVTGSGTGRQPAVWAPGGRRD